MIGIHKWHAGDAQERAGIDEARREHGASWPTYLDPGGALGQRYGGLTLPAFYVVARDGTLRWMQNGTLRPGESDVATLEREIETSLDAS